MATIKLIDFGCSSNHPQNPMLLEWRLKANDMVNVPLPWAYGDAWQATNGADTYDIYYGYYLQNHDANLSSDDWSSGATIRKNVNINNGSGDITVVVSYQTIPYDDSSRVTANFKIPYSIQNECTTGCGLDNSTSQNFSGGAEGAGGPNPKSLGTAQIGNSQGPSIAFNLGPQGYGETAGALQLNADTATASLSDPAALTVPYVYFSPAATVDVVTDSNGVIQQVNAPQGLVNVVTNGISNGYQLQMFYSSQVTTKTSGLYGINGSPFETWLVQSPGGNPNELVISDLTNGQQFTYTSMDVGTNTAWELSDGGGLRSVLDWQFATNWTLEDGFAATNYVEEIFSGTNMVAETQRIIGTPSGGYPVLLQEIDGFGSFVNTTTYNYLWAGGPVEQVNYPDGNWVVYQYTYNGGYLVSSMYSPYGNAPPPTFNNLPSGSYRETVYSYDTSTVPNDNSAYQPMLARQETVLIVTSTQTNEVSRLYRAATNYNEVVEWDCPLPGANYWDAGNLLTRTVYYLGSGDVNTDGRIQWQVRPDGTATIYDYQEDSDSGILTNIVMQVGSPDNGPYPNYIVDGTQTSTALNSLGQVLTNTTQAIIAGTVSTVMSQLVYSYLGNLQSDYRVVDMAHRTNMYEYASCGCGLGSTIDPDSVSTAYNYDDLHRQISSTVTRGSSNVTIMTAYDAAGRRLQEQRIGTDGTTVTLGQWQYDSLGRVVAQTNALGGVTTTTYAMDDNNFQVGTIITNADGGTDITTNYYDGRVESVSGTAVSPMQYQYGVDNNADGNYHEYTLAVKVSASGGTNEWTKSYTDGVGRVFKTVYSDGSSRLSYFNALGQLTNQVDPEGVSTLFQYDDQGRQCLTATRMGTNVGVNFGGADRITLTTNDVTTDNGANVNGPRYLSGPLTAPGHRT
jgi:YD repeat-containing protein